MIIPNTLHDLIINLSQKSASTAILTHINPDGDGFCSALALKRILEHYNCAIDIVVDDLNLSQYEHLNGLQNVILFSTELVYEFIIVLDCNNLGRLGSRAVLVDQVKNAVVIDHHEIEDEIIPNCSNWIDPDIASVGCMIYRLFQNDIYQLCDKDKLYVASCIYTTILNDTNNFTNSNTSSEVFEISSELVKLGIKPKQLYFYFMENKSPFETRFIGEVLSTIEYYEKERIVFMYATINQLQHNNLTADATSNLTRLIQNLRGVDISVFIRETAIDEYRVSLRSPIYNVHQVASNFGGGGHIHAAGFLVTMNIIELKNKLLKSFSTIL